MSIARSRCTPPSRSTSASRWRASRRRPRRRSARRPISIAASTHSTEVTMIRLLVCLVLLGAIGAIAAPADALAQTAPSVDKKRVAKQYVDAGLAAQSAGEYDTAITFYSKAYELVQHPTLIFNIAQAHRLAGRIEQALTLYKRYLSEEPNGPQAETARKLVSAIEARTAEAARKADAARTA